jgi:hypothetical protein
VLGTWRHWSSVSCAVSLSVGKDGKKVNERICVDLEDENSVLSLGWVRGIWAKTGPILFRSKQFQGAKPVALGGGAWPPCRITRYRFLGHGFGKPNPVRSGLAGSQDSLDRSETDMSTYSQNTRCLKGKSIIVNSNYCQIIVGPARPPATPCPRPTYLS